EYVLLMFRLKRVCSCFYPPEISIINFTESILHQNFCNCNIDLYFSQYIFFSSAAQIKTDAKSDTLQGIQPDKVPPQ
ncbi:MAG: hypothetical protein IKB12_00470, partial [Clostridia bacterium]|nr:hypothetical protein [Clostridia bacterium]